MPNPVIIETTMNVPITDVWDAITNVNKLKQWYFDMPDFKPEVGNIFEFYEPGGKNEYLHHCKVLAVIPLKKLEHTWTHPLHSKGTSILTWELKKGGADKTHLKLTHEGLEHFADAGAAFNRENYIKGWDEIINTSLKKFLG